MLFYVQSFARWRLRCRASLQYTSHAHCSLQWRNREQRKAVAPERSRRGGTKP